MYRGSSILATIRVLMQNQRHKGKESRFHFHRCSKSLYQSFFLGFLSGMDIGGGVDWIAKTSSLKEQSIKKEKYMNIMAEKRKPL